MKVKAKEKPRILDGEALFWLIVALIAFGSAIFVGVFSPVEGAEARPTPQSAWRNPDLPPPVPSRDFATPPTDGPEPTPTPPEPNPAPAVPGKAKTTTTRETEGGIIVEQYAPGTVVINSPGVAPASPAGPAMAQQFPIAPVIAFATNPQVQSVALAAARRVGGGLYYVATGKCPNVQTQATTGTPAAFLAVPMPASNPAFEYRAVAPVAAPAYAPPPAPQFVYAPAPVAPPTYYQLQAPSPAVAAAPMPIGLASPQSPVAPRKCRLFGR